MAWISLTILIASLANFMLAFAVLWRRHNRPVHFAFAFLSLSASFWAFSNFLLSVIWDPTLFETVGRWAFTVAVPVAYGALLLSWFFPEIHHRKPSRATFVAASVAGLVVLLLSFTSLIQQSVVFDAIGPRPKFGLFYPLFVVYMVGFFLWGVVNLLRNRRNTPSGRDRMQVNYCLVGFSLSFLGGAFCNFVMPQVTLDYQYYLLGSAWPLLWTSSTAYAICRHRLMDIGVVLRSALVHGIVGVAIFFSILLPFAMSRWLLPDMSRLAQMIAVLAVSGIIAFCLPRFQRRVKHLVDHRIFRGRYDHETAMIHFGERLRRTYGRENIAQMAVCQIPIVVQCEGCAIYLPETREDAYVVMAEDNLPCRAGLARLAIDHPLIGKVAGKRIRLSREEVEYLSVGGADTPALLNVFEVCRAVLAVPLISHEQTVGVMLLGEKLHDNVYSSDDLQLVEALASQLAFALDNARLYQQIMESERLYKNILQHMQRAVVAVDVKLCIILINDAASSLFDIDLRRSKGQPVETWIPELSDLLQGSIERGENQLPREIPVRRARDELACECETLVMRDAMGTTTGVLAVCQDLGERRKFEEDMRRMERLVSVGTLAAGIAHEIKNPLVSIQTFAQLLPDRHTDPEFRDHFATTVRGEINRINDLIHNLLHFAGPIRSRIGVVDLHCLVERAVRLLENEIKRKGIDLVRDLLSGKALVAGDEERLYQVFINLLQNAIQFIGEESPQVIIATRWTSMVVDGRSGIKAIEISCADNGGGIEPSVLPRIFDPFFSTRENGSGLGLAICHGVLQNHKAKVNVQSKPGEGTVFSFVIPASSETVVSKTDCRTKLQG